MTPARRSKPDAWSRLKQQLVDRAQVDLFDDFSTGLDSWQSGENIASTWSFDKNGFVNPGALSLFAPTMHLTNYDLDALVQIEAKGVGLVFRAAGARTYQAVRVLTEGSGPMPGLVVEHYHMLAGQASRPVRVQYSSRFQADSLYRIHLQVRGDAFSLYLQDQLVDFSSDSRLRGAASDYFAARANMPE